MDGPGISLFQGSDSLELNNEAQRQEEDEFIEEEKLRKAELKNLFENAFDDLIDDEDDGSTIGSSHYSASDVSERRLDEENYRKKERNHNYTGQLDSEYKEYFCEQPLHELRNNVRSNGGNADMSSHYKHCIRTDSETILNNGTKNSEICFETEPNGIEQLKVLYNIRLREIERLNQLLQAEQEEKNNILHKFNSAEADNAGLLNTYAQGQELLVASNEKIADLENEVITLKNDILNLEKSKNESNKELEIAQMQIKSLKQTMAAMERCDATINREKQMDELLNTVHVNYKKELTCLRHQLDSAVAKYNQKEVDCNVLEKKLEELEKKHSTTLLYKCDSMVRQESALQALLEEANKEKLEMNKKLMALQGECNMLKVDLEQYESVSRFRLGNSSSDEHETDSMLYLGINRQRNDSKRSAHSGSPQADIVAKLKDELHRALVGQRVKRSEIKKLQEQIQSKELQIHEMKEKERSYLADAESLKSDMAKIMDQLKKEDGNDNQTVISQLRSEILNLNNENEKSAQRIKEYQAELKKLSNEFQLENTKQKKLQEDYISYHESEVTKLQLQAEEILKQKELEYGSKVDRLVKECSDIKQLYEELKFKNEKMVARLEQESKKLTEALIETDNLKKLLTQKENEALTLGKVVENLQKGALHEEQVKNITDMSTIQANVISSLEEEIKRLHSELTELPRKQAVELEGLKTELELAKKRLIELEKELRLEFENENKKIMYENSLLRDGILKKENEIKLLKINLNSDKKIDAAVNTDDSEPKSLYVSPSASHIHEVNDKIIKIQEDYKKQLDTELKELENNLTHRHQIEISAVEERVKNVTVSYFTEEIKKINMKYKLDMQSLIEKQQNTVEDLRRSLANKQLEIDQMRELKEEDIKERFITIRSEFDAERKKAAEVMTQLAKEVQDTKKEIEIKRRETNDLKNKLSLIVKVKNEYKLKVSQEKNRVSEYKKVLSNVLTQCNTIMTNGATELENAISRVEQDYLDKEKILKKNLEKRKQINPQR